MLLTPRLAYEREFSATGLFQLGPARRCSAPTSFRDAVAAFDDTRVRRPTTCSGSVPVRAMNVLLVPGDLFYYRIHPGPGDVASLTNARRSTPRPPGALADAAIRRECPLDRRGARARASGISPTSRSRGVYRVPANGGRFSSAFSAVKDACLGTAEAPNGGGRDGCADVRADAGAAGGGDDACGDEPTSAVPTEARTPLRAASRCSSGGAGVKIVHLLGRYFPDSVGGTEVYVEGLVPPAARRRSRRPDCRARSRGTRRPSATSTTASPVFRYPIAGTPTRDEALPPRPGPRRRDGSIEWLAEERPDILHVHSFTTGVGAARDPRSAAPRHPRHRRPVILPGLGYMCRTGELMQWGRVPATASSSPENAPSCNLTRLGMPRPLARISAGALPDAAERMRCSRLPGRLGTALGHGRPRSDEYQTMQRELFALVDRFVVLNETGRPDAGLQRLAGGEAGDEPARRRVRPGYAASRGRTSCARPGRSRAIRLRWPAASDQGSGGAGRARSPRIPRDVDVQSRTSAGRCSTKTAAAFCRRLRRLLAGDPRVDLRPRRARAGGAGAARRLDVAAVPVDLVRERADRRARSDRRRHRRSSPAVSAISPS